jgi:hypothetical protein
MPPRDPIASPGQRGVRVYSSREYAQQQANRNAGSLLGSIRALNEPKHLQSPTENWLLFVYTLIESDTDNYLAELTTLSPTSTRNHHPIATKAVNALTI